MHFLTKKGISPLIATILIIGFTVALAAVIMTWGQSFTKSITTGTEQSTEEQLVCSQDVQFEVQDACAVNSNQVKLTVSNNAAKKIESFAVRYYFAADNVSTGNFGGNSLDAFAIKSISESLPSATLSKRVEMIPIVKVGENLITCSNSFEAFGESDLVTGVPLRNC